MVVHQSYLLSNSLKDSLKDVDQPYHRVKDNLGSTIT